MGRFRNLCLAAAAISVTCLAACELATNFDRSKVADDAADAEAIDASVDGAANSADGGDAPTDGGLGAACDGGICDNHRVVQITAGGSACARTKIGAVWCWGQAVAPFEIGDLTGAKSVSAGLGQTCAVLADGHVRCLDGDFATCSRVPCTIFTGADPFLGVSAGVQSNSSPNGCAWSAAGAVTCWGGNMAGELGNGTVDSPLAPKGFPPGAVQGLDSGIVEIATNGFNLSSYCARDSAGGVTCWGENEFGQLGHAPGSGGDVAGAAYYGRDSGTVPCAATPTPATNLMGPVKSIAMGEGTAFAVGLDGTLWAWGTDSYGLAGTAPGSLSNTVIPVKVPGLPPVATVSARGEHACALAQGTGEVWCWGANNWGQTGAAPTSSDYASGECSRLPCKAPTKVAGVRAVQIAAGDEYTLALDAEGHVWSWGLDWGNFLAHAEAGPPDLKCAGGDCQPIPGLVQGLP